jgi:hypothetical protein
MNPLVTVLAASRLTQLVTDDLLTQPLRDAVEAKAMPAAQVRMSPGVLSPQAPPPSRFWAKLDELVNCSACTSVWAAAAIFTAGRLGPVGRFLVRVLAVSQSVLAVQAAIQKLEDSE